MDDLAARVRELEAECARYKRAWDSALAQAMDNGGRCNEQRERAERAEAERDALRAEVERLRALLDAVRREQCQCRTCRAIRAVLAAVTKGA